MHGPAATSLRAWIAANHTALAGHERYGEIPDRFGSLALRIERLAEADALLSLKTRSRPHLYPESVLYNDARRYLLSDPL